MTITLDELNVAPGNNTARVNWDNFVALNQQYVRIEGLQVFSSPNRTASRPNWALRDVATGAVIDNDDISLAFRNDRTDYPSPFRATNDFTAPPVGATVNLQGFALLSRSSFDPHEIGAPSIGMMRIVPWESTDLVVTQSPPNITDITPPTSIPGNSPITITASITADQSRTLTGASLTWTSTSNPTGGTVTGTKTTGDTWSFQIPAQPNRDFVTFTISATDSQGSESTSAERFVRVLFGGITAVRDIQEPAPGSGDSPFRDVTTTMDLEVTVMTDPASANGSSDVMTVQDGTSPWSGIALRASSNPLTAAGVAKGDVIRITSGRIVENFGLTMIRDYQFEIVSQGGAPYNAIVVTTELLADADIAESLEGMLLRVENATVVATNADAPSGPFGEFLISNGEGSLRVDDQSDFMSYEGNDPGTVFAEGQVLAFVEGVLWYSFSNFKLEPESFDAIGPVTNVATESDVLPQTTSLHQNFPNPFNPTTSIQYDVATTGQVTLSVYDALGRHVETLVSSEQPAGTYAVQFNAARLSSGLYLYRLQTADKVVTRTMTLLK
ncbi:MAG: T9SS type A sorting domain-containing protein [Rhodothermales bacterium]